MSWNLFLVMFYGKALIIYILGGYLLIRYVKKGWLRFDPEVMVECRLKEELRKRKKAVNFSINLIVSPGAPFGNNKIGFSCAIDVLIKQTPINKGNIHFLTIQHIIKL